MVTPKKESKIWLMRDYCSTVMKFSIADITFKNVKRVFTEF